jgi:adenosylcobinamide kinase/adenosylcobinamide-phosphate guanylyltransferase
VTVHTLILGGVRSGKSRLAERLAHDSARPVTYIATAHAGDDEMRQRIAAHQRRRPSDWRLIEEPIALADVIARESAPDRCLLVECLTLWLTNLLMKNDESGLRQELDALLNAAASTPGRLILVGNETNLGIVPLDELTRRFCDLAGTLHQGLAARCDQVILTVAGLPVTVKGGAA